MSIRILTNHPGRVASPSWRAVTTYFVPAHGLWASFVLAIRLYRARAGHDCVVLGAGRSDLFFALLQSVLPWRRIPTMMIDCLWYDSTNPVTRAVKRFLMKVADRSVDRYCVWASREIDAYSAAFGLPRDKFVFVPYHTTLDGHELEPTDQGYLFAGGNWARDYPTLLRAVSGLPTTVHIACTRPELFENVPVPRNVIVRGYDHKAYLRMMAGCRANIVALAPGLLHSGGQQTFLNSMWLGKPTVVTDPEGARDYIEHGVDGLVVEPGNPEALRQAIQRLLEDPAAARRMGDCARARVAARYSTDDHFRTIIALATELTAGAPRGAGARQPAAGT
ncbi:MAG TPA: glycosyltransferase family 4 protein [Vicinamibacterales bacterium]|nr:glycosyltransferase family 4 protein [Vicinamibacterales bacterium]